MRKPITWPEHMRLWAISGLSKKEYCLQHDLSYQVFFYHQRNVRMEIDSKFHEVELFAKPTDLMMEYNFIDGTSLSFPSSHLKTVLDLLRTK